MNKVEKIRMCKVNDKKIVISTSYIYGDISTLFINGKDAGVSIWGKKNVEETKKIIVDGINNIYGTDTPLNIEFIMDD